MSDDEGTWLGLPRRAKPLVQARVVLGLGLGGFFDGIVVHQLLQWHHMVSGVTDATTLAGLRLNVLADGFFHVATYVFTVAGVVLLWRAWRRPAVPRSGRTLFGSAILGWGLFNLVKGLVDHQLLGIHPSGRPAPAQSCSETSPSCCGARCSSSAATPSFARTTTRRTGRRRGPNPRRPNDDRRER